VTYDVQASLITEQPKLASWEFTPLIAHCGAAAVVEVVVDLEVVVLAVVVLVVVVLAVVVLAVVVFAVVVLAVVVLGVVFGCRLSFFAEVQEAVAVTSVIGTKELQNAEALRATRTALQLPTLSRATSSER
jgi:hypothetical protein